MRRKNRRALNLCVLVRSCAGECPSEIEATRRSFHTVSGALPTLVEYLVGFSVGQSFR